MSDFIDYLADTLNREYPDGQGGVMRRQSSGMGTKRGEPAYREPIGLQRCRGCGVEVNGVTCRWDDTRQTFSCNTCDIDDPCGLFGPMRPAPVAEQQDAEGA